MPIRILGSDKAVIYFMIGHSYDRMIKLSRQIVLFCIDLDSEAGWRRLEGAIDAMIQGTFAEAGK